MAARKPYVLKPEDYDLLARIRKCEALRLQSHKRRDELVIEARRKGIPLKVVGAAFGVGEANVSRIMNDPFQGVSRRGKRRTKEGDVQESS